MNVTTKISKKIERHLSSWANFIRIVNESCTFSETDYKALLTTDLFHDILAQSRPFRRLSKLFITDFVWSANLNFDSETFLYANLGVLCRSDPSASQLVSCSCAEHVIWQTNETWRKFVNWAKVFKLYEFCPNWGKLGIKICPKPSQNCKMVDKSWPIQNISRTTRVSVTEPFLMQ